MGFVKYIRSFFEMLLAKEMLYLISLAEGQLIGAFSREEVLQFYLITPFDSFAIWGHLNQLRIV